MPDDKVFLIDIRLSRGWIVVLSCLLVIAVLFAAGIFSQTPAVALSSDNTTVSSGGMRQYYLSIESNPGVWAKSTCSAGYHMASLWEIADPSNLKYNSTLGYVKDDSGSGPPGGELGSYGWVRTGYASDKSTVPGRANCNLYTSHSFGQYGTSAALHSQWTSGVQDIGPWDLIAQECDDWIKVWCVED